jgi:hypothetical protein
VIDSTIGLIMNSSTVAVSVAKMGERVFISALHA